MNAVRQSCRPKHQVLVLKCYPRHQKNQTSVKPNGSELSYLLYYASTRRSKLQKVGAFLEKRIATDVWHGRIGSVQVTLEIVSALIEKCPRELPLFAGSVLRILQTVLKSGDATMVERTVEVWDAFCEAQDPAMLAADQSYIRHYEDVLQVYVAFASKDKPHETSKGGGINVPLSMRFRKVGLDAIRAIAHSDTITAVTGRQINLTVPVILENIYSTDATYLQVLQQREFNKEQLEKEAAMKRRQSVTTVRTDEDSRPDADAALGTTADADKLAEQDVAIVALQALRRLFSTGNKGQVRLATSAVLKFIGTHVHAQEHFEKQEYHTLGIGSWPTNLLATMCSWAPVQDRFVILVTAMETLVRSPIVESDLEKQYVLTTAIGWLLSSTINFIGLSVMDVLVGLMQHISLLLQLGGGDSNIKPHHQQSVSSSEVNLPGSPPKSIAAPQPLEPEVVMEVTQSPSEERVKLLNQLLWCIGNLATHVYYRDQIADMIIAIMRRLKPSQGSTATAIQDPSGTVETLARTSSIPDRPGTDSFFSFDTARTAALQAVKAVIMVANGRAPDGSSNAANRSQIGTGVWEGTQWLLRDPNMQVRLAYHDAIVTWLNLEARKVDLKVQDDAPRRTKSQKAEALKEISLARRAVSKASSRDVAQTAKRSAFLDLLHLAIYDNVHQYSESEQDIILLHSLNCALIQKLGINSVRSGLPMIMSLQREIPRISSRTSRINIASLVHGYLWACSVYFEFDASATARTILDEIAARTKAGTWLQTIRVPPMMPHQFGQSVLGFSSSTAPVGSPPGTASSSEQKTEREVLNPFDNRSAFVDKLAQGYSLALYSPPNSPPGSPNRSFSQPFLGNIGRSRSGVSTMYSSVLRAPSPGRGPPELPQKIREDMMVEWSKEACIASTAYETSRSTNGSGRMSGRETASSSEAGRTKGLAALDGNNNLNGAITGGPVGEGALTHPPASRARLSTPGGASPARVPPSSSSARSTVRIEDLKRVLSGATAGGGALRTAWSMRGTTAYGSRSLSNKSSFGEGDLDADTGSNSGISAELDLQGGTETDAVLANVHVPHPPGLESPTSPVENPDAILDRQATLADAATLARADQSGMRSMNGHSHEDSQHTIKPSDYHQDGADNDEGVAKPAAGDATNHVPSSIAKTGENGARPAGNQRTETDAASSVYITPGESPAAIAQQSETPTPRLDGAVDPETPRATRYDYFAGSEARGLEENMPKTAGNGAMGQVTPKDFKRSNEIGTNSALRDSGRGTSAHSSKGFNQSQRQSAVRTTSSNTASRVSYAGANLSPTSTQSSGGRSGAGAGSMRGKDSQGPAIAPGDVKSLLAGIDVDSWGSGHGNAIKGRPPY